jgi:hypothetical protein
VSVIPPMARSSRRRRAANVAAGMLRGDFRSGIGTLACSVFPCDTSGQSYHLSGLCQRAGISWRVKAGPPASRVPGFSRLIIPARAAGPARSPTVAGYARPPSLSYLSRLSSAVNKAGLKLAETQYSNSVVFLGRGQVSASPGGALLAGAEPQVHRKGEATQRDHDAEKVCRYSPGQRRAHPAPGQKSERQRHYCCPADGPVQDEYD